MIEIEIFVENRYRQAFDNAIEKLNINADVNIICEEKTYIKGVGSHIKIQIPDSIYAYILGLYYGQEIIQIN